MSKRILSMILAALTVLACLASCKNNEVINEKTSDSAGEAEYYPRYAEPGELSEQLEAEIIEAYRQNGMPLNSLPYHSGIYDYSVVICLKVTAMMSFPNHVIDCVVLPFSGSLSIKVYRFGEIVTLQEAYDMGRIKKDDLRALAEHFITSRSDIPHDTAREITAFQEKGWEQKKAFETHLLSNDSHVDLLVLEDVINVEWDRVFFFDDWIEYEDVNEILGVDFLYFTRSYNLNHAVFMNGDEVVLDMRYGDSFNFDVPLERAILLEDAVFELEFTGEIPLLKYHTEDSNR